MVAAAPRLRRCELQRCSRHRAALAPRARALEKPSALRLAVAAAADGRSAAADGCSAAGVGRSLAGDLVGASSEPAPPLGGTSRRGAAEVRCPSRALLGRVIAPRDRPESRRERPFLGLRNWATAVLAAATRPVAHRLRVEEPTSRSRRSTDGWLSGRVVAAPRHSFDIDPSTARRGGASRSPRNNSDTRVSAPQRPSLPGRRRN